MNARQSVIVAMFLSVAVYLLANARATSIVTGLDKLKQVPAAPIAPAPQRTAPVDQRPGSTRLA